MKTNWAAILLAVLIVGLVVCVNGEAVSARESVTVRNGETVDDVFVMGKDIYVYGRVEESAVSLGGNVYVEYGGYIEDDVVAIGGDVYARSGSTVDGDVVSIGGSAHIDPGAEINGSLVDLLSAIRHNNDWDIPIGTGVPNVFRLILLGPFAGAFGFIGAIIGLSLSIIKVLISLGIAAFITYLMPGNVIRMSDRLRRTPIRSFLVGMLCLILLPFLFIGLIVTLVGIPLIPLIIILIILSYLLGSVGISLWIGRLLPNGEMRSPMRNVVIGVLVVALLKLIPGIGFLTGILMLFLSLGVVALSGFGSRQQIG